MAYAKAMAAALAETVSRERAAREMKASFLRVLTADQLAEVLLEQAANRTDNH